MANTSPDQIRTVDPYSSYNSNVVNRLTRMISDHTDCLFSTHAIEVTDSTSDTQVVVGTGHCFKDDVLLEITSSIDVDFTDSDFYVEFGAGFNETGYYYIVLDYEYVKAKPAPVAEIKIIKPSQRATHFTSQFLFLKAVYITGIAPNFVVTSLHDYDPENTSNRRIYSPLFAGVEDTLPTFSTSEHEGKIIYVRDTGALFWGMHGQWEEFQAIRDRVNSTACSVGMVGTLVYDGTSTAEVQPAIATANETLGDCIVLESGLAVNGTGQVRLAGRVDNVLVETGIPIATGHRVYLSATEAGKVTNLAPADYPQYLGRAVTPVVGGTISMWFVPWGEGSSDDTSGFETKYDKYQDLLQASMFLRITYDTFGNLDYVNTGETTATIDVVNREMDGEAGETLRTTNLLDAGYDGSNITYCQVSADVDVEANVSWYVTNEGSSNNFWEPTTLNILHNFSEISLPIANPTAFTVGEIITGQTSTTQGICNAVYNTYVLISQLKGTGIYTVGETIEGAESLAITTVPSSQTWRNLCDDLRVRADFSGTAAISDYGILYEMWEFGSGAETNTMIADIDADTMVETDHGGNDEDAIRFTTAGTEMARLTTTGLGIGVTPAETLHVDGGVRFGYTSNQVGGSMRFTGADYQVWDGTAWTSIVGGGGGGGGGLWVEEVSGKIHFNNNNVGINQTDPQDRLHVTGTIRATAFTSASDLQLRVSGVNAITAKDTTRLVGINTDLAASRLDIAETTTYPTATLKRVDATITDTEVIGEVAFAGTQGVDTASPTSGAAIYGRASADWASSTDAELVFLSNAGSGLVERALINEKGLVSLFGLVLNDTSDTDAGTLRFHNGSFQGSDGTTWVDLGIGQWADGPSSSLYYNVGNVGIGTTIPSEDLDVASNIATIRLKCTTEDIDAGETFARVQFSGTYIGSGEGAPLVGAEIRGVGSESWQAGEAGSRIELRTCPINSTTLATHMVVEENGFVRVGSSSTPTETLDVDGAIRIGTTVLTQEGTIRYHNGSFEGYDTTGWTTLSGGGGGGVSLWTQSGSDIYYNTGNVAIGTDTPEANRDLLLAGEDQYIMGEYRAYDDANAEAGGVQLLSRARGSEASPTALDARDRLGSIIFQGYNGSAFSNSALIHCYSASDGVWSGSNYGGNLEFRVTPYGETSHQLCAAMRDSEFQVIGNQNNDSIARLRLISGDNSIDSVTVISTLDFAGIDGYDFDAPGVGARILAKGAESWSGSQRGTDIKIQVCENGSTSLDDAIFIQDDRKIGLNQSSTTSALDITADTGSAPTLTLKRTDATITGNEELATISWAGTDSGTQRGASIVGRSESSWASNNCETRLEFMTCGNIDQTLYNRMVIKGGGKVGIGTDLPSVLLEVSNDTTPKFGLKTTIASIVSTTTQIGIIEFNGSDGGSEEDPQTGAQILCISSDAWDTNDCPARIEFQTCPDASDTLATHFTVGADGDCIFSDGIQLGSAVSNIAGAIQWDGSNFQGYDGGSWIDLDQAGGVQDNITEGNSNVTVTDVGSGNVQTSIDAGAVTMTIANSGTPFLFNTTSASTVDIARFRNMSGTGGFNLQLYSGDDSYVSFYTGTGGGWAVGSDESESGSFAINGTYNTISGSNALTITAGTHNVGLGTIKPSMALDVCASDGYIYIRDNANLTTGNHGGGIYLGGAQTSDETYLFKGALIEVEAMENYGVGQCGSDLLFYTTPSSSVTPTEKMRIKDDGDVVCTEGIVVGEINTDTAGAIEWDGTNFRGYTGSAWKTLDNASGVGTFAASDTTPDIAAYNVFVTGSDTTDATTITNFDNGVAGKEITIIFSGTNDTTIQDNANVHLAGGSDFVATGDDTLKLVFDGTYWYQTASSVN